MMKAKLILLAGAMTLVAACDAQMGNEAETGSAANLSADGKALENTFSIKAPGVDIKVAIPADVGDGTDDDSDGDLLYPGATMNGVHIEGAGKGGAVELRFTSADAPEKIAAWYRDPAGKEFTIDSAAQEGAGFVLNGSEKGEGDPFKVSLSPRADGGTDGRLSLVDRE